MSRIAKAQVHNALSQAARNIIEAGGNDGITSRNELTKALKSLPKTEAALTNQLYRFIDHRDHVSGARITQKDVNKAVVYAKKHIIDNRDVNNNGLSQAEVRALSNLGKLAVAFAQEVSGASNSGGPLSNEKLGKEINAAMKDVNWISEGDSTPEFVLANFKAGSKLDAKNIMAAFKGQLEKAFVDNEAPEHGYTAEVNKLSKADLADLAKTDSTDPDEKAFAAGFARFKKLAEANLTEMVSVKVGPKDEDGSLGSDQGMYARFMVGRTQDGKLAGIMFSVVET